MIETTANGTVFYTHRLNNGLQIVGQPMPDFESVSVAYYVRTGSRDEPDPTIAGVSHFLEHMVFKGTRRKSSLQSARSLESLGGQLNAFTGKELTCFYAHVVDQDSEKAVEVLSDILQNSTFLEKELDKEKLVVLEEIKNVYDTPDELIHEYFVEQLYNGHPLGYTILGPERNVKDFTRKDLKDFIHTHYYGSNIVIAAAGNLDHDRLVHLAMKYFRFPNSWRRVKYTKGWKRKQNYRTIEDDVVQTHICLGTECLNYRSEQKFDFLVLNTLLGGGMSSRLFQSIREKNGLAYSVYTFTEFLSDTGVFGVYVGTDRKKINRCIDLIKQEFNRVSQESISKGELERIKSQLKGNLLLGLENTSSRMNRVAKMEIYLEKYYSLDDIIKEIDAVTPEKVKRVAREIFNEDKLITTVLTSKAS